MRSLKYILNNKKTALLLYFEDLAMFFLIFLPLLSLLNATTKGNYYSINFTIDYVVDILPATKGISAYGVVLLFLVISYFLIRIFLLSGIFSKLLDQNANCLKDGKKNFLRFFALFIIYLLITAIVLGLFSYPFNKAIKDMYNLKQAYILSNIRKIATVILIIIVSLFHTSARISTIKNEKLKFFAMPFKFMPFFGYQFLAVFTALAGLILSYKLVITNTYAGLILSFLLFQVALFFRITFKLASYKTLC